MAIHRSLVPLGFITKRVRELVDTALRDEKESVVDVLKQVESGEDEKMPGLAMHIWRYQSHIFD